jgi:class 3 adenylate cyclase
MTPTPAAQERRWVSVVFFDLVRFTELTLANPLEDSWRLVDEALQSAASQVRIFGGQIDKFLGDGILAVFGIPTSQESDAKAALQAAKAMVEASPLPARVGVASGLVLRTPLGGGITGDQTVLGPAVNLAQRLSAVAQPGEVWTEASTLRLVPAALAEAMPPQFFKGFTEPLTPLKFLVMREEGDRLFGREAELRQMEGLLEEVVQGAGRRVLILGEMGMGKSQLVQQFLAQLPSHARGFMGPRLGANAALRYTLRQSFSDLVPEGPEALKLEQPFAEVLGYSLGLEERPEMPTASLDHLLVETWLQVLQMVASRGPVVLVLEDLHASDPTVLEFTRRTPPPGVLLVMTSRRGRWTAAPDLTTLELKPLALEAARDFLKALRPGLNLNLAARWAEASGGLPLALQAIALSSEGEPEPIPMYQPRIDTLPRLVRTALYAAAVIGESSPPELIFHLVGEDTDLERLLDEGFLERDPGGNLGFRVPWLREAALGHVGSQQTIGWHKLAAQWFQGQRRLGEAASHLEAAGEGANAYRLWRLATQQAWAEGRHPEALMTALEAMRLAEGGLRHTATLEAAEYHLALGRLKEAQELARLVQGHPEASVGLVERSKAIQAEVLIEQGQYEPAEDLLADCTSDPRARLAMARLLPSDDALVWLENLPGGFASQATLRRAETLYRQGELGQAETQFMAYLEGNDTAPLRQAQARTGLAGLLWRRFQPKAALELLGALPYPLPPGVNVPWLAARAGLLMDLGRYSEAFEALQDSQLGQEGAPLEARARVAATFMRYLIESGQVQEALEYGNRAVSDAPTPWLLANLALCYALTPGEASAGMLKRLVRVTDSDPSPDVRALSALAQGLRGWHDRQAAKPHLKRAIVLARRWGNPTLYYSALSVLGFDLLRREPLRAMALSQHLLGHTASTGFVVGQEVAQLLRIQLLIEQGREVAHLMQFTPTNPLNVVWHNLLRQRIGERVPEMPLQSVAGYGILGNWIRVVRRGGGSGGGGGSNGAPPPRGEFGGAEPS